MPTSPAYPGSSAAPPARAGWAGRSGGRGGVDWRAAPPHAPMPTAAPPAYDAADPGAYVENILRLVGDRDPLALLEGGPDRLAGAVSGLSDADVRRPPRPGAWSALGVVRHLADSEVVYGYRLRLIVASSRPAIPGYDQDAWAERLRYDRGTVTDTLDEWRAARRGTLRFLRALGDDDWDRVGLHSERGEESVRHIATLLAGHDLNHERQVRAARDALGV